jgi:putative ABC transport system permease protein
VNARLFARAALYAYPAEFRAHFGEQIVSDIQDDPTDLSRQLFDLIRSGISMRLDGIFRDIAYALRRLRAAPSFVAIVVLTFALGIGANIAVFSVLNAVVLRPLPYLNPAGLITLTQTSTQRPGFRAAFSQLDVQDIAAQSKALTNLSAAVDENATMLSNGKPVTLEGVDVTPNYFTALGITPQLGRAIESRDQGDGVKNIVISDGLWRKHFAGDPGAIGRTVTLDRVAYRIIGILKPGQLVAIPSSGQIVPVDYVDALPGKVPQASRGSRYMGVVGRLAPGATLDSANAELRLISARLAKMYPTQDTGVFFAARSLTDSIVGDTGSIVWTVFGCVLGILLIACANVANVLGARWSVRDREFALRRALGASSTRIAAQLLIETGILALLGGIAGLILAVVALNYLGPAALHSLPRGSDVRIDSTTLLYALGIVVLTTFLAGLVPVLSSNEQDLHSVLKTAGRGGGSRGQRLRAALAVAEIALTLALVVVSGLMVRSFVQLAHTPLGVRTDGVLVTDIISLADTEYPTLGSRTTMQRDLLTRLRALPGVASAAETVQYPLGDISLHFDTAIFGEKYANGAEPSAAGNDISPGYFATMSVPVRRGRDFNTSDTAGSAPVAIVNESFVQQYLHGREPIGVRVRVAGWNGTKARWAAIVGVVGDERQRLDQPPSPMLYSPLEQAPPSYVSAVLFAPNVDRVSLTKEIQDAFARAAPAIEPPGVYTMNERVALRTRAEQTAATLLIVLSIVALLLALTGVFGVVSFSVSQRLHEFGVRMALGARSGDIIGDVVRRAAMVAGLGVLLGLIVAAICARAIQSQLHDVSPFDPVTFVAVIAVIFICACLAAFQPALRATRVEPNVALRYE